MKLKRVRIEVKRFLTISILSLLPFTSSHAATAEQCYAYFTELVRSSNFPFAQWEVKPHQVNLVIDEDNESRIRAKLIIDTDGTGTIGWVIFNKDSHNLFNTTIDPDEPVKLRFNKEYDKAHQYCLRGEPIYQVIQEGRLYLSNRINEGLQKTAVFIVKGDYVQVLGSINAYSHVTYQTKAGNTVSGWVDSKALREIDFNNTW